MAKDIYEIDPQLVENLRVAKAELEVAKAKVLDAESAIYVAGQTHLPEKGTVHLGSPGTSVTVVTGYTEKWDQQKLSEIETTWVRKSNLAFPFKKEFKPDAKAITYIRENAKDAYAVLADALTITPKKPSFEIKDAKE